MNRLTVSIPIWQREALDNLSKSTGQTLSEILRDLINEHFKGKQTQAYRSLTETSDGERIE
jgi:predicted DNA-binding protein